METLKLTKAQQTISNLQEKHSEDLLSKSNVVGYGVGKKISNGKTSTKDCLTVFVTAKVDVGDLAKSDLVPSKIGDIQTDVIEVGQVFAQSDPSLRKKVRPAEGGYSVGHYKITAGTIGTCVVDRLPTQ